MNPRRPFLPTAVLMLVGALFAVPASRAANAPAKGTSDLTSPAKRQATVEIATRLTKAPAPTPSFADVPQPFNPTDFDKPDPEEVKSNPGGQASHPSPGGSAAGPTAAAGSSAGPSSDHDILETLAAKLVPSGSFTINGKPLLVIGKNRFEIGTKFVVTYNNQDYELELTSIDRTTFTLRYRGEEVTRPIKPVK